MVGRQLFVGEKWSLREGQQYIYIYIYLERFLGKQLGLRIQRLWVWFLFFPQIFSENPESLSSQNFMSSSIVFIL